MTDINKAPPDWERIEAHYRAGLLSVREIATLQGITEGAIRKRAKRDTWSRDLHGKVRARADEMVLKASCPELPGSDHEVVEANAEVIAAVRVSHRDDIRRARELTMSMLDDLGIMTENVELFVQLGELLRDPDDRGVDKDNDEYQKTISLSGRVIAFKALSDTLKNVVKLEREAFDMDAPTPPGLSITVQQNNTLVLQSVQSAVDQYLDMIR